MEKKLVVADVIAGHVIPNKLVFTAPLDKVEQKTATYTDVNVDDIKVTAIIQSTSNGCKYFFRKCLKFMYSKKATQ